jgi:hypothetical protein
MSTFIGWIDVNLVVSETLSILYQASQDSVLCAPALACLYELVKKGMDPWAKAHMIDTIGIVPLLCRVPFQKVDPEEANYADDEDEEDHVNELGMTVDMIAMELLGCWSRYEEMTLGDARGVVKQQPAADEAERIRAATPMIAKMLHTILPLVIRVFSHAQTDSDACTGVHTSISKILSTLQTQRVNEARLPAAVAFFAANQTGGDSSAGGAAAVPYLQIADYYPSILGTIYRQMHYPADFQFDATDDDDAEVMEVSVLILCTY